MLFSTLLSAPATPIRRRSILRTLSVRLAVAAAVLFAAAPCVLAQNQAKLTAGDAGRVAPLDQGGRAVAVSGGAVAVGAFLEGANGDASGRVYLYEASRAVGVVRSRSSLRWNPALRIVPADAAPGARFGYALSLDSGTLAVGAVTDSRIADSAGAVYVFDRDHGGPGRWGQTARLTPPLLLAGQRFGFAVAVNGNTLVASAPGDGRGAVAGTVYVFERDPENPASWSLSATLRAPGGAGQFGFAVGVSGDDILVGAPGDNAGPVSVGAVYVYSRNQGGPGAWGQTARLLPSNPPAGANFGISAAIHGDTLVAGASGESAAGSHAGAAYVFERSVAGGAEWTQTARLTADTASEGDLFGFRSSVAIRGDTIAVGALGSDAAQPDAGAVYLFQRVGANPSQWAMTRKLIANDPSELGNYGLAVSLGDEQLAVSASRDTSATVDAGLVYVTPAAGTNVTIDINPGVFPNSINPLNKNGVIAVGVFTTPSFDATTIDISQTSFFGGIPRTNLEVHATLHLQNLDNDGDTDALLHFKTSGADAGIRCSDTFATLQGKTLGGEEFMGMDSIQAVGGGCNSVSDLEIAKTLTSGELNFIVGTTATYRIDVTNLGPASAQNVVITDTLNSFLTFKAAGSSAQCSAAGQLVTCNLGTIGVGTTSVTIAAEISLGASGVISNFATVAASSDPNAPHMSNTVTTTVIQGADLAITKTDGAATAIPGTTISYTIAVTNNGPLAAMGATVADMFPAGLSAITWTCAPSVGATCTAAGGGNINDSVNLPNGGSVVYTVMATILSSATGSLVNTATVTAPVGTPDPVAANNSATDTNTLTPEGDLAISKTDGVTMVNAGGALVYTIVASNPGPSDVTGATVADTFPAVLTGVTWSCTASLASCAPNGSGNLNELVDIAAGGIVAFMVSASVSPTGMGTISNTASIAPPIGFTDTNGANNMATDNDTVIVNLAPTIATDPLNLETVGNIQLTVAGSPGVGPEVYLSGSLASIAGVSDPEGQPLTFSLAASPTPAGTVTITDPSSGEFTYAPLAGSTASDTFDYDVSDGVNTSSGTVNIDLVGRVVFADNSAAGGPGSGTGTSGDPFHDLSDGTPGDASNDAEDQSVNGDTIFVLKGDSASDTDGYGQGITLKNQQRLIGEAAGLTTGPACCNSNLNQQIIAAGAGQEPFVSGPAFAVNVPATAVDLVDIEIAALNLSSVRPIQILCDGGFNAFAAVGGNTLSATGSGLYAANLPGCGSTRIAFTNNTVDAAGAADAGINVDGMAGGTAYVTAFSGNSFLSTIGGTGANFRNVIFDADPTTGAIDPVIAGNLAIGDGSAIGGQGLVLTSVMGELTFGDLDISSGGKGLFATGGPFALTTSAGSTISSLSGGAMDLSSGVTAALTFDSVTSENPVGAGISVNDVAGSLTVTGTTTIGVSGSAAAGISLIGASALNSSFGAVNMNGGATITAGVDLGTPGTTTFNGPLHIVNTGGTGFNAVNAGTVTVSDNTSTISTTDGTALNVSGTSFPASFASIAQSGTAAGNGINISGSAGTKDFTSVSIANTSGIGIALASAGTVNINTGSINSTGQAFSAASTVLGVNLASTSSSGGANNILLDGNSGSAHFGVGAISGSSADAFRIAGGSVMATYGGSIGNSSGDSVAIVNTTAGIVELSGTINDTGTGVTVENNSGASMFTFSGASKILNTGVSAAVNLNNNPLATIGFTNGGLEIDTTTGIGFSASNGGIVNVSGAGNSVTASSGQAVDVDSVTTGITFASLSSTNSPSHGVDLTNLGAGSAFSGGATTIVNANISATSDNGALRILTAGNGSDIDFGATSIDSRNGTGIFIDSVSGSGGSPSTIGFGATTIPNPDGSAGYGIRIEDSGADVTIASATIGNTIVGTATTYDLTDGRPTNDGDGDGIFLKNNTGEFSFAVNGGTFTNIADNAVDFRATNNVTLNGITIGTAAGNGSGNAGLLGDTGTNLSVLNSNFAFIGDDVDPGTLQTDNGMTLRDIDGTLTIQNTILDGSEGYSAFQNSSAGSANRAVELDNRDVDLDVIVTDSTIRFWDFQGLNLRFIGGSMDVDIGDNTPGNANAFMNINSAAVSSGPSSGATSNAHTTDVLQNSFTNVGVAVEAFSSRGGDSTVRIVNNTVATTISDAFRLNALAIGVVGALPNYNARVTNNTVTGLADGDQGNGGGFGFFVTADGESTAQVLIDSNSITGHGLTMGTINPLGMLTTQQNSGGEMDIVFSNNTAADMQNNFFGAMYFQVNGTDGANSQCIDFSNNSYNNVKPGAFFFDNIFAFDLTDDGDDHITLGGFVDTPPASEAEVAAYLDSVEATAFVDTDIFYFGAPPIGGTCLTPNVPPAP